MSATAKTTILIVEEAEKERENFQRCLDGFSDGEIRFREAKTGGDGLEAFSQIAVDCILLGLPLPDMSAQEFLSRFSKKFGDCLCPILILTDEDSMEDAGSDVTSGTHDYISKSNLAPQLLQKTIANATEKVGLRQRLQQMHLDLEVKNRQLQVMKDHLEKLVEERTHDLLLTNERLLVEIEERRKAELKVRENAKFNRMIVEQTLQETEAKFSALFRDVATGIALSDLKGNIIDCNAAFQRILGHRKLDILGHGIKEFYAEPRGEDERRFLQECKAGKRRSYRIDKRLNAKDGHTIWGRLTTSMILGVDQVPQFVVHMLEDITPQKENEVFIQKSLDEKQVLLREVHHRVKNNLQVIQSLLRMQAREVKGSALEPLLRESQNRIRSIALIHEQLYKRDDFAEIDFADYLNQLLRQLFHTFTLENVNVTSSIDFRDIYLSLTKAIPCALIANELVTNSLKYAFQGKSEGKISINASQNNGWLTLIIKDDGTGFPKDLDIEASETLGLKVVRTLIRQLGGEMELISDEGVEFRFSFIP